MCRVLGDVTKQIDACRLRHLEEQKFPLIQLTSSSGKWSEAQSTFPSGKVTGEKAFAVVADKEFGWPPSLLITAQGLGENQPPLHPQLYPLCSGSPSQIQKVMGAMIRELGSKAKLETDPQLWHWLRERAKPSEIVKRFTSEKEVMLHFSKTLNSFPLKSKYIFIAPLFPEKIWGKGSKFG